MMQNKEVVIGGGLSAVLYAYCTDSILLRSEDEGPPPFDFFDPTVSLGDLGTGLANLKLSSSSGFKIVGAPKKELWERLSFLKSMSGGIPFSDKVTALRVNRDDNTITVATSGASTKIEYDKLRVFDDKNLHGISDLQIVSQSELEKKYKVLDWFDVRSGCRHEFDYLSSDDQFVRELFFYPSDRVDGNHDLKDLVTISYLSREELNCLEFSDTYARLKAKAIMKENGIRGTRNGRDTKNPQKSCTNLLFAVYNGSISNYRLINIIYIEISSPKIPHRPKDYISRLSLTMNNII